MVEILLVRVHFQSQHAHLSGSKRQRHYSWRRVVRLVGHCKPILGKTMLSFVLHCLNFLWYLGMSYAACDKNNSLSYKVSSQNRWQWRCGAVVPKRTTLELYLIGLFSMRLQYNKMLIFFNWSVGMTVHLDHKKTLPGIATWLVGQTGTIPLNTRDRDLIGGPDIDYAF